MYVFQLYCDVYLPWYRTFCVCVSLFVIEKEREEREKRKSCTYIRVYCVFMHSELYVTVIQRFKVVLMT